MQTVKDETYNGWANYPTWAVNLWLSNDKGLYNTVSELVGSAKDWPARPPLTEAETIRYEAMESIKSFVRDDLAPDLGASFAADLLGYALDQVDWYEIADSWLQED